MTQDVEQAKRTLRALLRGARPSGDVDALRRTMLALPLPEGAVIGGVWPLPGEPDLVPVWQALHARGHPMCLPETTPPGRPLLFRRWRPGDPMLPGRFGTAHPPGEAVRPDLVFVPLLAWDPSLMRLGYGGGYYDRTLAAAPGLRAVGVGFESQRLDRVPAGPYDVRLHAMATERRVLEPDGQAPSRPGGQGAMR